jgi:hypothetical protein
MICCGWGWLSDRDRIENCYLLLEVLPNLVIHLKLLLELFELFLFDVSILESVFCRRDGWAEKVEE